MTDQASINSLADFSVNLSVSQTLIDQFDMSDTRNQSISDQNSLASVFSALSNFNKYSRKSILFFSAIISTKKSCKIKFSIQFIFQSRAAFMKNAQNTQQNEQEIQLRAVSELNFMQIITRNF